MPPQGGPPAVLGLPAYPLGRGSSSPVALARQPQPAGPLPQTPPNAAHPSDRRAGVDPPPGDQRGAGGDEQQDQADQSSGLRLPDDVGIHRQHLPLLRRSPATLRPCHFSARSRIYLAMGRTTYCSSKSEGSSSSPPIPMAPERVGRSGLGRIGG